MSIPLKPCPFCGEKVKFTYLETLAAAPAIFIHCCFITTDTVTYGVNIRPRAKAEKQLATLWNMRI